MEDLVEKILKTFFLLLQIVVALLIIRLVLYLLGYSYFIPFVDPLVMGIVRWLQDVGFKLFSFSPF